MKRLKSMRIRLSTLSNGVVLSLSRTRFVTYLKTTFLFRLYQSFIFDSIFIVRNHGFKELLRRKGMKFFIVICLYYLIRDSVLYLLIPFLIARGLIN